MLFVNCFLGCIQKIVIFIFIILQNRRRVCYNLIMNIDLSRYAGKKICVACSGGRDSMALLYYLYNNRAMFGITLSALNCDHGMRGKTSARDSAFVAGQCAKLGVPLLSFRAQGGFAGESQARLWRVFGCYAVALLSDGQWNESRAYASLPSLPQIHSLDGRWRGCDCIATAHHMDDNAETVLFNLARGSALAGVCGIRDEIYADGTSVVHPLTGVSRRDIENYIADNGIDYVDDESNFTDDYTRNYIRHNVLPALNEAVPGATAAIYRFSRLAAEDEEYLSNLAAALVATISPRATCIRHCEEKVIFRRAAISVIEKYGKKDYTSLHARRLYELQFAESGKKFAFLGLTAYNEGGDVVIAEECAEAGEEEVLCSRLLGEGCVTLGGQPVTIVRDDSCPSPGGLPCKVLACDGGLIPEEAVVRTCRSGDKFKKFGGGTKSLGDFFTDKKIPVRLRHSIPLIACGSEVLVVCGVEISECVKVTPQTKNVLRICAYDYSKL